MRRLSLLLSMLLAISLPAPSTGQTNDVKTCETGAARDAITACGRLLQSGAYKGRHHFLLNLRGGAHQRMGNHDRAIADFDEAARLDARFAPALINRGISWAALGEYDRAIGDFDQAIRIEPKNAFALNNRGGAFRDKGAGDLAIADFDRAIAIDPKYAVALYNRGNVYQDKREYDRAIADYNSAIASRPKDTDALRARGRAWTDKGDLERARADYRAALATPAKDQQGRDVQAAVRTLLGVLEKSLEERKRLASLEKAERLKRANPPIETPKIVAKPPPDPPAPPLLTRKEKVPDKPPQLAKPAPPSPKAPPSDIASAPAPASRVALVVGNARYSTFRELANPRHDAEDVAKALQELGFKVQLSLDVGYAGMKEVLAHFAQRARLADTALVFYAGHGLQRDQVNYLAPVDAFIDDGNMLKNLIDLRSVIADLEGASRVRLLIVDACRDSGAVQRVASRQAPVTRTTGITRGLARIEIEDGKGTLVAFATQPNNVATDGAGRNSPFTSALLKHLSTPGLELRTLLTRVRAEVVNATSGRQRPEVVDSLVGEVVFKAAR